MSRNADKAPVAAAMRRPEDIMRRERMAMDGEREKEAIMRLLERQSTPKPSPGRRIFSGLDGNDDDDSDQQEMDASQLVVVDGNGGGLVLGFLATLALLGTSYAIYRYATSGGTTTTAATTAAAAAATGSAQYADTNSISDAIAAFRK